MGRTSKAGKVLQQLNNNNINGKRGYGKRGLRKAKRLAPWEMPYQKSKTKNEKRETERRMNQWAGANLP